MCRCGSERPLVVVLWLLKRDNGLKTCFDWLYGWIREVNIGL